MPAAFRNWPSVAPGCRIGTTGTPGQNCAASFSTGAMISRVSGGGGGGRPRGSRGGGLAARGGARASGLGRPGPCGGRRRAGWGRGGELGGAGVVKKKKKKGHG